MNRFESDLVPRPTRPRRKWRRLVVFLVCATFAVTAFSCCYVVAMMAAALMNAFGQFVAAMVFFIMAASMFLGFATAWVLSSQEPLAIIVIVLVWLLYASEWIRFLSGLLRSWGFL